MWLKLKISFGYAVLVLLLAFIVYQFRQEPVSYTHLTLPTT